MASAPSLRDRTGFWLAIAGVLAVLGGTPIVIAGTAAATVGITPWSSSWFIFGFAVLVLAGLCVLWSVVLYVAHHHAEGHWCPDPEAHLAPASVVQHSLQQPLPNFPKQPFVSALFPPAGETRDVQRLRSALRQMRSELISATKQCRRAVESGHYWSSGEPSPALRAWKRNHEQLAQRPGMGGLIDAMTQASSEVNRIAALQFPRLFQNRQVYPKDRLPEVVAALEDALHQVSARLDAMGG